MVDSTVVCLPLGVRRAERAADAGRRPCWTARTSPRTKAGDSHTCHPEVQDRGITHRDAPAIRALGPVTIVTVLLLIGFRRLSSALLGEHSIADAQPQLDVVGGAGGCVLFANGPDHLATEGRRMADWLSRATYVIFTLMLLVLTVSVLAALGVAVSVQLDVGVLLMVLMTLAGDRGSGQ